MSYLTILNTQSFVWTKNPINLGESREPLPMRKGSDQKIDSEYVREGTCSIFIFTEPLGGVRHVNVRKQRTSVDWAEGDSIPCRYWLSQC